MADDIVATKSPKEGAKVEVYILFDVVSGDGNAYEPLEIGKYFQQFEFKSIINSGYVVSATLYDPQFNLQAELIERGYLDTARTQPVIIKFRINYHSDKITGEELIYPQSATKEQIAIITSMKIKGDASDNSTITFIAVDPATYYLNIGWADGSVFKGNISNVIRQVVEIYAYGRLRLNIQETLDSKYNKWWMMRMDPMTFIMSLLEWSSTLTTDKTNWLIASDGNELFIKEQASHTSKQRGYYSILMQERSSIQKYEMLADNSLNLLQTKLITNGLSSVSGSYYDQTAKELLPKLAVNDENTSSKIIAKTSQYRAFKKPDINGLQSGSTSITSIPEIYSGGELGLPYDSYIDGKARGLYLNMINRLMRVKFTVIGHGEYFDSVGLGVDTIFINWLKGYGTSSQDADKSRQFYWMTGNWLLYGFHQKATKRAWHTDLYCARYDHDSSSRKVPELGGASGVW